MRNERIRYLLEQYYSNTLSDHEAAELSQLLDTIDQEELIDILGLTIPPLSATENFIVDEAEIDAKVNQILALDKNFQLKTTRSISILRMLKYSAVAAIAILIGSYWLFNQTFNASTDQKTAIEKDVQPGKNGAILVLSDGTQVSLDSALDSKVIVSRNGSKIRISNGQVVYLDSKNVKENELNSIETPVGRKYNITLSDGTKVWLNASSSISYPIAFSKKTRKVTISGEVYFEVAKNPRKPFIVNIQNSQTNIEVLGTHFNVNTYADHGSYKTSLLEGSIKLNAGKRNYLLTPNQQAVSQPGSENVRVISDINPEDIMAWKNDLFQFNEADIDDVMFELARWYDIKVVYDENRPPGTFTGKIQKNLTLRQALKILGATRVKYELTQDNKLIIKN
ncbi:FecR family protein [Pedobacter frigoris]|uniref:FecR family protein n=1 Tax=Pedobacter frigoris TaxID=2571272 RepID=A0A4U1CPA9_9SPHI|nr:FecR family protein [Pedobacter frigoris]TKC08670.1 FecR family protein [Pedobacter frigoris]